MDIQAEEWLNQVKRRNPFFEVETLLFSRVYTFLLTIITMWHNRPFVLILPPKWNFVCFGQRLRALPSTPALALANSILVSDSITLGFLV